jgi:hypothetical protein
MSVACRRELGNSNKNGSRNMRECSKISNFTFYGSLFTLVERQHSLVVQQWRAFRPVLLDSGE